MKKAQKKQAKTMEYQTPTCEWCKTKVALSSSSKIMLVPITVKEKLIWVCPACPSFSDNFTAIGPCRTIAIKWHGVKMQAISRDFVFVSDKKQHDSNINTNHKCLVLHRKKQIEIFHLSLGTTETTC